MTVLFLIVARGGSKRVPGKNLRTINGLSLVGYKIKAAQQSAFCSRIIISTDDPNIFNEGKRLGAEVFMRKAELATDTALTEDVVRDIMERVEPLDAIMLLEPSSPFVSPEHYEWAIQVMEEREAEFIFGDVLYLFRWDYLKTRKELYDEPCNLVPFQINSFEAIDIDTEQDLLYAEFLASHGCVDLSWAK